MSKVVSINNKKFLSGYSSSHENERVPGYAIFFPGVVLTMIVPVVDYCSYHGPVPPMVFAGIALAGTIAGIIRYHLLPCKTVTRLGVETPQTPASVNVIVKKAA